jgi:hypothetical protein
MHAILKVLLSLIFLAALLVIIGITASFIFDFGIGIDGYAFDLKSGESPLILAAAIVIALACLYFLIKPNLVSNSKFK